MGQLAVWTNGSLVEQGATECFSLDLECDLVPNDQTKSNNFIISMPIDVRIAKDSAVFIDYTPWGGLVQGRASDTKVPGVLEWRGRTWLGILADRILVPDAGQEYSVSSGTVSQCISALLSSLGLSTLFSVGECPSISISSYQHKRYPNGMDALYDMLASKSLKPTFKAVQDNGLKVLVGASEIETATEQVDGEINDLSMLKVFTPYNHIIALGEGEGLSRIVQNYYADENGNVSTTKSISGLAERTYKYDYPNADADELQEQAVKKLQEFQGQGSVDVSLPEGSMLSLGDNAQAYDQRINETVTARINKCVVKVENGMTTCAWSAGE